MKSEKIIQMTCRGNAWLKPDELEQFQGNLKTLSEQNYQKLKTAIADPKIGFSFPIFVWRSKNRNYIIDGHQRLITIRRMLKEGGASREGNFP